MMQSSESENLHERFFFVFSLLLFIRLLYDQNNNGIIIFSKY